MSVCTVFSDMGNLCVVVLAGALYSGESTLLSMGKLLRKVIVLSLNRQ